MLGPAILQRRLRQLRIDVMNKLAKLGLAVPLLTAGNLRFKKMVEDEVAVFFAATDQTETAVVT